MAAALEGIPHDLFFANDTAYSDGSEQEDKRMTLRGGVSSALARRLATVAGIEPLSSGESLRA